jgi:hypothetical protein
MTVNTENRGSSCCASPSIPVVPLPMAMFGMVIAFVCGAMLGTMMSHKRGMMMQGGHSGRMMHGGMKGHHHHGEGSAACCCEPHGEWQSPEAPPAE